MTRVRAKWVLGFTEQPLPGGVVVYENGICRAEPSGPADHDASDCVLLPGLVNAHTHLDLSGMRGIAPPSADYTAWLRQVIAYRRTQSGDSMAAVVAGLDECRLTGTTVIGDISGDGVSGAFLGNTPGIVFRELLGLSPERIETARQTAIEWLGRSLKNFGFSPHAPYSTAVAVMAHAASLGRPMCIHLAEWPDERDLLERRAEGPLARLMRDLGVWQPDALASSYAEIFAICESVPRLLIAHGNYLRTSDNLPANAAIVHCPRTHAAFGHPPAPLRQWLDSGIPVALGTDSLASNPDLNLLGEMRHLAHHRLDLTPGEIVAMATRHGRTALGISQVTDCIVVPVDPSTNDPYTALFEADLASNNR